MEKKRGGSNPSLRLEKAKYVSPYLWSEGIRCRYVNTFVCCFGVSEGLYVTAQLEGLYCSSTIKHLLCIPNAPGLVPVSLVGLSETLEMLIIVN